jgi:hypothetical protein
MLAEKFFLVLETLRSHAFDDEPEIVTGPAQHSAVSETPPPETATGLRRKEPAVDGQN